MSIARAHYFERQFLLTRDFIDEQDYHLTMRRRHNIAHHTWGIVFGLEVVARADYLVVRPGMAVDGYGRELILSQEEPLSEQAFDIKGSETLDVWLAYDLQSGDGVPQGYTECQSRNGDQGTTSYYRTQEQPRILMTPPNPAFPDRRKPEEVADSDQYFSAERALPDDPARDWPVFLGQVRRTQADPPQYEILLDDRPYAGLVGEAITTPSGEARIQLGTDGPDESGRFAFFASAAAEQPRLEIDHEGTLTTQGAVTVNGDLTLHGGAVEFPAEPEDYPPPKSAGRIYRAKKTADSTHQLRVEMLSSGQAEIVLGAWADGEFKPCLTIKEDCSITIHGDLHVNGTIDKPLMEAPLTVEAKRLQMAAALSGLSGASAAVPRVGENPPLEEKLEKLLASPTTLAAIAAAVGRERPRLVAFLGVALAGYKNDMPALISLLVDAGIITQEMLDIVVDNFPEYLELIGPLAVRLVAGLRADQVAELRAVLLGALGRLPED